MDEVFNAAVIAKKLIEKKSITPNDGGCQEYIKKELENYKFSCENINLEDVKTIWLPPFCLVITKTSDLVS